MVYVKYDGNEICCNREELPKTSPIMSSPEPLSLEHMNQYGWYELVENKTFIEPWQYLVKSNFIVDGMTIIQNYEVKNISLEEYKKSKKEEAKLNYENEINAGCLTQSGIRFDCDEKAINMISSTKQLMDTLNLTQIEFRDYDNIVHTLTYDEFVNLATEVAIYYQTKLKEKWTEQDRIDAATTYEEI